MERSLDYQFFELPRVLGGIVCNQQEAFFIGFKTEGEFEIVMDTASVAGLSRGCGFATVADGIRRRTAAVGSREAAVNSVIDINGIANQLTSDAGESAGVKSLYSRLGPST